MNEEKTRLMALNAFTQYLKERKMRCTPERYAILDKVCDMASHFHVEQLYESLESESYHVSKATVYNTMETLVDSGIVRKYKFNDNKTYYEKVNNVGVHHLVCTQCGAIKEVKDAVAQNIIKSRRYPRFHMMYMAVYVYGICSKCVRQMNKEKKTNKK